MYRIFAVHLYNKCKLTAQLEPERSINFIDAGSWPRYGTAPFLLFIIYDFTDTCQAMQQISKEIQNRQTWQPRSFTIY